MRDETYLLRHRPNPAHALDGGIPRLQLRTVKELMEGKAIERPSNVAAVDETFKKTPKAKAEGHEQTGLAL
jgi:hypothetical protein